MTSNPRLALRVVGENGHWYAASAPAHVHGSSSGNIRWGCACDPCLKWRRDQQKKTRKRNEHNRAVISRLVAERLGIPTLPPPEVEAPPEPETPTAAPVVESPPVIEDPAPEVRHSTWEEVKAQRAAQAAETQQLSPHPPPPITPAARSHITTVAQFEDVSRAYFSPQWTVQLDDGKTRQAYGNAEIIVAGPGGPILFVGEREQGAGESELLVEQRKAVPKAKGGRGGSQAPTDHKDLIARLKAAGCQIDRTNGGHIKVTLPNGEPVILPSTTSDWRAVKNNWGEVKRALGDAL